jgi:hypothetical protein
VLEPKSIKSRRTVPLSAFAGISIIADVNGHIAPDV